MTLKTKSTLLLVLITAIWGATFPLMKEVVDHMPPMMFVAIRFLSASILSFAILAMIPGQNLKISRREWSAGFTLGGLNFIGYCTQAIGMQSTTASNAGFISGLSVVFVPLIYRFQGQPMSIFSWIGVTLSFAGVALLSLTDTLEINPGDLWICACAVGFAFQIIQTGILSTKNSPMKLAAVQLVICGGMAAVFSLVFENPLQSTIVYTPAVWGSLAFCAIFGTSFAYIVQMTMQKHTSAPRAALIYSFEPVFAVLFAFILLGEVLSVRAWIGASLMMLALFVTDLGPILFKKKLPEALDAEF